MRAPSPSDIEKLLAEEPFVRSLAKSLWGDEADDLVQQAWLRALGPGAAFVRQPRQWLARIVRNLAQNLRRSGQRRRAHEHAAAAEELVPSSAELLEREERRRALVGAVDRLPPPLRTVVLLRWFDSLPPRAIAAKLGVPVATVASRLHRALALLRERLDAEHGGDRRAWLAALLPFGVVRTASIATVHAASAASVFSASVPGVLIMSIKAKVAGACGVLLLAGAALWIWSDSFVASGGEPVSDRSPVVGANTSAPAPALASAALPADVVRRDPVTAASSPVTRTAAAPVRTMLEPLADQSPVLVAPFEVRILAVSAEGKPVPDAAVEVWGARKIKGFPMPDSIPVAPYVYSGRIPGSQPVLNGRTDESGRYTIRLNHEQTYVEVFKTGVGATGDVPLYHLRGQDRAEWIVTLIPQVTLTGQVVAADGSPAVACKVYLNQKAGPGRLSNTGPFLTDERGCFSAEIMKDSNYGVMAYLGRDPSHQASVETLTPGSKHVIVRFPGAHSIGGLLLDPGGRPVAGKVTAWEQPAEGERLDDFRSSVFVKSAKAAADGRYRIHVPGHGNYLVIGSSEGHANSEPSAVEVGAVRPHAVVDPRLLRAVGLHGTVEREDGGPVAGATLLLTPDKARTSHPWEPSREARFGKDQRTDLGADGSFHFAGLHPGTTWTLSCYPDLKQPLLVTRRHGIMAGGEPVRIVIRAADAQRSTLAGTVVAAGTGDPVGAFSLSLVDYLPGGSLGVRAMPDVQDERGRFSIGDLLRDQTYGVVVDAKGFGRTFAGPWTIVHEEQRVTVIVQKTGAILLRVTEPDGTPAKGVDVMARLAEYVPGAALGWPQTSDAQGHARFADLPPARYLVTASRGGKELGRIHVDVAAARTTDVELALKR